MFLRFLRLGTRVCALGTLLSMALIPTYVTGSARGNDTEGFNMLTLARVSNGESRLWGTVACWWVFVLFVLYELWNEWRLYAANRYNFLARGDVDTPKEFRYAIRVEQIPYDHRSDAALKAYFSRLFPNQVRQAIVYFHADQVQRLVDERQKLLIKVEKLVARTHVKPNKPRPTIKVGASMGCCGGRRVDAIDYYMEEINRLNNEIDKAREAVKEGAIVLKESKPRTEGSLEAGEGAADDNAAAPDNFSTEPKSSTGFVTFTSLRAKQAAVQCELTGRTDSFVVVPAPDPNGIIWNNITTPLIRQRILQLQAMALWTAGALLWSFPITFVTSIANLNSILAAFDAKEVDTSTFWYGLVSGLLPVLALAIFMELLYRAIVAGATFFIRFKSLPEVDSYTLFWHQIFQFANLWNIVIVGSAFNQIPALLENANGTVDTIARAIPGSSIIFVNMILVGSFAQFGLELSMLPTHGIKLISGLLQPEARRTQRMLDEANKPPSIEWGKQIPPVVFIFLVSIMYMPIVPIMEIFALVYFMGSYVVWKHQCLHVYAQEFEGGGDATWQQLFGFLMACLYLAELVFIGYMSLKKARVQSILSIALLGITIFVHVMLNRNVIDPVKTLSLQLAADVDFEDGELPLETRDNEDLLYALPALNPNADEREPMPYRRNATKVAVPIPALESTGTDSMDPPEEATTVPANAAML